MLNLKIDLAIDFIMIDFIIIEINLDVFKDNYYSL